jgi:hypothetical protein
MSEEIIAYRVGEGLFCPDCYEKGARTLKAVQRPEDPEVKFPSKPIKVGDIRIFICEQCKTIKGTDRSTGEKIEILKREDLFEFSDIIEHFARKVAFIGDFFSQREKRGERPKFSEEGFTGFYFILRDLQDEIESVVDQMLGKSNKGLIIEKTE